MVSFWAVGEGDREGKEDKPKGRKDEKTNREPKEPAKREEKAKPAIVTNLRCFPQAGGGGWDRMRLGQAAAGLVQQQGAGQGP